MKPALFRGCRRLRPQDRTGPSARSSLRHGARARQQKQANDIGAAPVRMIGQNLGETLDLVGRQKPIARHLREAQKSDCRIVRTYLPSDSEIEHLAEDFADGLPARASVRTGP